MEELRATFARDCMACLRTIRALTSASATSANRKLLRPQLRTQIEDAMGAAVAVTDRVARGSVFEFCLLALREESRQTMAKIVALAKEEDAATAEAGSAADSAADEKKKKADATREMRKTLVALTETLRRAKDPVAGFDINAVEAQPADGSAAGSYVARYANPQDVKGGGRVGVSSGAPTASHFANLEGQQVTGYVNLPQRPGGVAAPLYEPHSAMPSYTSLPGDGGPDAAALYEPASSAAAGYNPASVPLYATPESQNEDASNPATIHLPGGRLGTVVSLDAPQAADEEAEYVVPMAGDDGLYTQPQEGGSAARPAQQLPATARPNAAATAAAPRRAAPVGPPPSDKPPTRPNRL